MFFQEVDRLEDDGQRAEHILVANPGFVTGQIQVDSQGVQYADVETTSRAKRPGDVKTEVSYQEINHTATKVTLYHMCCLNSNE